MKVTTAKRTDQNWAGCTASAYYHFLLVLIFLFNCIGRKGGAIPPLLRNFVQLGLLLTSCFSLFSPEVRYERLGAMWVGLTTYLPTYLPTVRIVVVTLTSSSLSFGTLGGGEDGKCAAPVGALARG